MLTPESRLANFPALAGMTYLNTAAESIPPVAVHEALDRYWEHKSMGMRGRDHHFAEMERCRETAARLLERQPAEVAFCSCSAEAYNLLASALQLKAEDEVVLSDLDFPSGATPWLAAANPPQTAVWQNREGVLHLEDLEPLLNERTRLVQVSLVSFLTGYRLPWAAFRDRVRALAPRAILSVDVTQAFGRVELDCLDADVIISSTHKWILGSHGGCVVAIREERAEELTTHAGGWFHLRNAFDADRFERVEPKRGAASFATGMPNFPAIYCLRAGMETIEQAGVAAIEAHANPLVEKVHAGLASHSLKPMSPWQPDAPSGIVAFQHARSAELHAFLEKRNIHIMHQAGRVRVAVHGYNASEDVDAFLRALEEWV